jgi:predicted membrane-bound spermidine synthase
MVVAWHEFALPFVSLTLAVSIVAFFAPWGLYQADWYRVAYVASTGAGESEVNAALGAELSTSVILVGAMLLLVRRWRTPLGTFALLFGTTTAMFNLVFDGTTLAVLAAVVGGACADMVLVRQRADVASDGRSRIRAAAALGAFAMVSAWHLLLSLDGDLEWPAPLAAGTPVLAALAALALTGLAMPAPATTRLVDEPAARRP